MLRALYNATAMAGGIFVLVLAFIFVRTLIAGVDTVSDMPEHLRVAQCPKCGNRTVARSYLAWSSVGIAWHKRYYSKCIRWFACGWENKPTA